MGSNKISNTLRGLGYFMKSHKVTLEPDIYGGICLCIDGEPHLHFKTSDDLIKESNELENI